MQNIAIDRLSPRFYHVILQQDLLEGWSVIREWGNQGSPGRVRKDHYTSRDEAVAALMLIRDNQLRRGFQVVYSRGEEYPSDSR